MRKLLILPALLAAIWPLGLAFGQANNPASQTSLQIQGPDPTGNAGYPLAVVGAPGGDPVNVAVSGAMDQGNPNAGGALAWPVLVQERAGTTLSSNTTIPAGTYVWNSNLPGWCVNRAFSDSNITENSPFQFAYWGGTGIWLSTGPNGVKVERERTPHAFQTIATAAAGNTAIWTPPGQFRLMRWRYTITGNATLAAPGVLTVSLNDAGAAIGQADDAFIPAVAVSTQGQTVTSPWIDLGNGILAAAAGDALNVNLSAALATGSVRVQVCGTEE